MSAILLSLLAAGIFLTLDCAQTCTIARNPERFREMNVILGPHPSVGQVKHYFAIAGLGLLIGNSCLWREAADWAIAINLIVAGIESFVVWRNNRLGVKIGD